MLENMSYYNSYFSEKIIIFDYYCFSNLLLFICVALGLSYSFWSPEIEGK